MLCVQIQGSPRLSAAPAPAQGHMGGGDGGGRVWGWLEGAGPLPNVLLRGAGAALGRGRDPGPDLEALRLGAWSGSSRPRCVQERHRQFGSMYGAGSTSACGQPACSLSRTRAAKAAAGAAPAPA